MQQLYGLTNTILFELSCPQFRIAANIYAAHIHPSRADVKLHGYINVGLL